ncbi:hypothetical protein MTO96_003032 [Rhipicephalus appendiculatus]
MAENAQADQSWRTQPFRQNVRGKIEEAIRQAANPPFRSATEMENHVFQKARSKDEYLSYVARLIIHVREMSHSRKASVSALTDELHRVGAVASYMPLCLDNPFDSDRARHKPTYNRSCAPALTPLLTPMEAVPVAKLIGSNHAKDSASPADTTRDLDLFDPDVPNAPANQVFSNPALMQEATSVEQSRKSSRPYFLCPC